MWGKSPGPKAGGEPGRPASASIPLGVLALGFGVQAGPRAHPRVSVLLIFHRHLGSGRRPGGGGRTIELVTVAARSPGLGLRGGIGVEAPACTEPDQAGRTCITEPLRQLAGPSPPSQINQGSGPATG